MTLKPLIPLLLAAAVPAAFAQGDREAVHTFQVDLDAQGRVTSIDPVDAIPDATRAALQAHIANWRFEPRDGATQATRTYLRVATAGESSATSTPRIISASTGPAMTHLTQPVYPTSELRRGEGGVVVLEVAVGADGRVHDVGFHGDRQQATRSMAQAARDAALAWQFTPEQVDGQPVASTVVVPVCFMAVNPDPYSCTWQGPEARNLSRYAVVNLDPVVRVDIPSQQIAGF